MTDYVGMGAKSARALGAFLALLFLLSPQTACARSSKGQIERIAVQWDGPQVPLWIYRPQNTGSDAPVVFVLHGVERDARRYLREWMPTARRMGFVLVAPEFTAAEFPGQRYALGGITGRTGSTRQSYEAIEPAFDTVRRALDLHARTYAIYGHSAGAQFVQRFVFAGSGPRASRAVAANAGWYLFPTAERRWPYGLDGAGLSSNVIRDALQSDFVLILSERDTATAGAFFSRTAGAMSEGRTRFERGQNFFSSALTAARQDGVDLRWSCVIVSGAGHSNRQVVSSAASVLFSRRGPPHNCARA